MILVGEIRDRETAATALKAAETGHLVISAIHTPDAVATIQRYVGLFETDAQDVVRDRLGDCLQAVVSLRLLASKDGRRRLPAVEILRVTRTIRECIRVGAPRRHPRADPQGPRPLLDAAVRSAPDRSGQRRPRSRWRRRSTRARTPKSSSARCASSRHSRRPKRRMAPQVAPFVHTTWCRSVATHRPARCALIGAAAGRRLDVVGGGVTVPGAGPMRLAVAARAAVAARRLGRGGGVPSRWCHADRGSSGRVTRRWRAAAAAWTTRIVELRAAPDRGPAAASPPDATRIVFRTSGRRATRRDARPAAVAGREDRDRGLRPGATGGGVARCPVATAAAAWSCQPPPPFRPPLVPPVAAAEFQPPLPLPAVARCQPPSPPVGDAACAPPRGGGVLCQPGGGCSSVGDRRDDREPASPPARDRATSSSPACRRTNRRRSRSTARCRRSLLAGAPNGR